MGCDIHSIIQTKQKDGSWKIEKFPQEKVDMWERRNYPLFAILADVRNHYDITPISKPRYLPIDLGDISFEGYIDRSYILSQENHSHSYLTLKDLMNYDWDQIIEIWNITCKSRCSIFYDSLIPELQRLAEEYGGNENVRIVFSFDN